MPFHPAPGGVFNLLNFLIALDRLPAIANAQALRAGRKVSDQEQHPKYQTLKPE